MCESLSTSFNNFQFVHCLYKKSDNAVLKYLSSSCNWKQSVKKASMSETSQHECPCHSINASQSSNDIFINVRFLNVLIFFL